MCLQLIIKKPPGNFYKNHPAEIVDSLIGCKFSVATNSELSAYNRLDLINTALAVDINQIIFLFDELGQTSLVNYWKEYLINNPGNNFLLFGVDREEVELSY